MLELSPEVGKTLLGNPWWRWAASAGVALGVIAVLEGLRWAVASRFKRGAVKTPTQVDDAVVTVLERTRAWFSIAAGLCAGLLVIVLPEGWRVRVLSAGFVVLMLQAGFWAEAALRWTIALRYREIGDAPARRTSLTLLRVLGVVAIWSLVLVVVLSQLGYDVSALLTGLGIGGIAVALALQSILGDLFASISIVLDKPFEVGDVINVDDETGTVESIGLKTTRVTSIDGEQIAFANSDLLKARVHNFNRMQERRVLFPIRVVYETRAEQLEAIPSLVQAAVESTSGARFDRCHMTDYGTFGYEFETCYYVNTRDYRTHMNARHRILLDLLRRLQAQGIVLATTIPRMVVSGPAVAR